VKKVFNALLYADKPLVRFPKGVNKEFSTQLRIGHVLSAIYAKHRSVSHLFCQNMGLELMFKESEILVDVLLQLTDEGITALPIHDAVMVGRQHAKRTKEVMTEVFRLHTGTPGEVREDR
jgi:hypothetical protein